MIAYLDGILAQKSPTEIILDVNGVGYQVSITLGTFESLGNQGEKTRILTYLHVREDILQLYGFATDAERQTFHLLLGVSGIGPRMAQGILSGLSVKELREAISRGNLFALTSISGVGKKTAERIVLELRDKIGKIEAGEASTAAGSDQLKMRAEALVALMSLGYTRQNAEKALRAVLNEEPGADLSTEELIKRSLRHATR